MASNITPYKYSNRLKMSVIFLIISVLCLPFTDLSIITFDPMDELGRLVFGIFSPSLSGVSDPLNAVLQTIAFALLGVALASIAGLFLALFYHHRIVRVICAFVRSVHELFWALLFLQIFGFHPITGLLAIGLPYAATFAKIYAEIIEESDDRAYRVIRQNSGNMSSFIYGRIFDLWPHFVTYTSYRFECGLRSSIVLGFVGLPTLGYYLSTAFMEGEYSEVGALLFLFYFLIASIRYWMKLKILPFYLLISPFIIANESEISFDNISRFFTQDIIPAPIKNGESLLTFWHWLTDLFVSEALPGIVDTVLLTQLALVLTALMALLLFPLVSKLFFGHFGRGIGHGFLVVLRSTPEYIFAFVLLILWGPSMLPAVIALTLHNGAIIAHLMGRYSSELNLRVDKSSGLHLYYYEVLPRIYGQFLAFLFYRWEVIMRETAILGILGITSLGFYIDNAIEDVRFDKAVILIVIAGLLNTGVDAFSYFIRSRLKLKSMIESS